MPKMPNLFNFTHTFTQVGTLLYCYTFQNLMLEVTALSHRENVEVYIPSKEFVHSLMAGP